MAETVIAVPRCESCDNEPKVRIFGEDKVSVNLRQGTGVQSLVEISGLVILLYKSLSRTGAGGSEKGRRRAMPVR